MLYNLSRIFKRAHRLRKKLKLTLSEALRRSWRIEKEHVKEELYLEFTDVTEVGKSIVVNKAVLTLDAKIVRHVSEKDINKFNLELAKCTKTRQVNKTIKQIAYEYVKNVLVA